MQILCKYLCRFVRTAENHAGIAVPAVIVKLLEKHFILSAPCGKLYRIHLQNIAEVYSSASYERIHIKPHFILYRVLIFRFAHQVPVKSLAQNSVLGKQLKILKVSRDCALCRLCRSKGFADYKSGRIIKNTARLFIAKRKITVKTAYGNTVTQSCYITPYTLCRFIVLLFVLFGLFEKRLQRPRKNTLLENRFSAGCYADTLYRIYSSLRVNVE